MQPKGRCQYIFDSVSNSWVPWEGTVAGFGGVTLFTPSGQAISTPTGLSDNVVTANLLGSASFTFGYDRAADNWNRTQAYTNTTDALATDGGIAHNLSVTGLNYGFNGATFDRLRSFAGNADALVAPTLGLLGSATFSYAFNGATFDRLRTFGSNANGLATVTTGLLGSATFGFGFTGSIWDRLRTIPVTADAVALPSAGIQSVANTPYLFNGTTFDRPRVNSAATLALATQIGVQTAAPPGNWSITDTPAANTQATISRAAAASTRHVCTSIFATLTSAAASASGVVQVNLRDGATGAGTVLWSQTVQVGGAASITAGGITIALSGLSIVGSVNTAMTLEFSAAGGANTFESVAMTGYDAA